MSMPSGVEPSEDIATIRPSRTNRVTPGCAGRPEPSQTVAPEKAVVGGSEFDVEQEVQTTKVVNIGRTRIVCMS